MMFTGFELFCWFQRFGGFFALNQNFGRRLRETLKAGRVSGGGPGGPWGPNAALTETTERSEQLMHVNHMKL